MFIVAEGTENEKTFEQYYKAYDYAMFLFNTYEKQVPLKKGDKTILVGPVIVEAASSYESDIV